MSRGIASLVAAALLPGCVGAPITATAYFSPTSGWSAKFGVLDSNGVAWASFTDPNDTLSAFGSLTVRTSANTALYNDTTLLYGAGFVEAAVTSSRIHEHWDNMYAWLLLNFPGETKIPQVFVDFFTTQDAWVRANIASNNSAHWAGTAAILAQFDGLVAGYAAYGPANASMSLFDFQALNAIGDFLDLIPALTPNAPYAPKWNEWNTSRVMDEIRRTTHCSGLWKITGNYSDLFFGHSAWFTYQSTLRVYKHYRLTSAVAGRDVSFSSYPGVLSSLDDFYTVWSSNITVVETTNSILNSSLYELVGPSALLAWQRVRLANLLAATPSEWSEIFAEYNSGTYNNAYGVLSLTNWAPGAPLQPDTLWLVEQIPGLVVGGDVTSHLERGYFPQYNVPFWPEIYYTSGYPAMIAKHADPRLPLAVQPIAGIDYQLAPRAQIFRRDQAKVVDFESFLAIMRYNDYKNDPYAQGSPWNAICSRGDLAGSPDGCYDTKASSASQWSSRTSMAINGPTLGDGSLPPFSWAAFPTRSHEGLPYTYNFTFEVQQPAPI